MSEEYNELSSELIILNRKKYELEEKASLKFPSNSQQKEKLCYFIEDKEIKYYSNINAEKLRIIE